MSPAKKTGPAADRVQGIDSSLSELTLRNGRSLKVEIGGAMQPTPTLTRTINGASSISLTLHDRALDLLDSDLLSSKFDVELDGLWFRYMAAELDQPAITLTLEERAVSKLRELKGPKKAYARRGQKNELTRAEFVISLIREVKPTIPFYCPQLHEKQPIKRESQGKKAKGEAKENRDKGIGDSKGLKVKGQDADAGQRDIVERNLRVAEHDRAPFRVRVAMVAALIAESECRNLRGGDGTSKGDLQVIDTTAAAGGFDPNDVEASAQGFLTGYVNGEGGAIAYYKHNPSAEPADIATATQDNRDGASSYAPFVAEAREWVEAYEGGEFGEGSINVTEPFSFEVGKDEDYWTAIKRLAKEVNWRAFFVAGRFFFIDEIELFRGMVRLAIDRDTPGIRKVKFKWNANRPATELEIEAEAKQWQVPPGAVITLAGYGPASIGFGDAPVKANAKGQKAGLSSNREARSRVGRARYLVESIEGPLRDDEAKARLVTIKARKPTAPLPEPAAKTKSVSVGGSGSGSYVNPFPSGWTRGRIDQGVDFAYTQGAAKILAIGQAKILAIGAAGWPGGGGVLYELLDGPRQGQIIFVYEGVVEHVHAGQKVEAGDVIATGGITGSIEIGFADASGVPVSHAEYTEGKETKGGKEMSKFLDEIGAP